MGASLAPPRTRPSGGPGTAPDSVVEVMTVHGGEASPELHVVRLVGDVNARRGARRRGGAGPAGGVGALAGIVGSGIVGDRPAIVGARIAGCRRPDEAPLPRRSGGSGAVRAADRLSAAGATLHLVAIARSESERVARIMSLETVVTVHTTLEDAAAPAGVIDLRPSGSQGS